MDEIPLTIEVPDAVLDDLDRRLEATRWPGEIPGSDWDYGTNLGYVQELVDILAHPLRLESAGKADQRLPSL